MHTPRALCAVIIAVAMHATAFAQQPTTRVPGLKARLASVEQILNAIQSNRQIDDPRTGERILNELDNAATEAKRAVDTALAEAKLIAGPAPVRPSGTQPTVQRPPNFEFLRQLELELKGERNRVETIIEKIGVVDRDIRLGQIRLTRRAITALTPAERREFRQSLTPAADREYRRVMPDLFQGSVSHLTDEEWRALKKCGACEASVAAIADSRPTPGLLTQIMDAISEGITPSAHGALAVGCYLICKGSVGTACAACISTAGAAAINTFNAYNTCKNNCCGCRWTRPWCCGCRALCLAAFLTVLA